MCYLCRVGFLHKVGQPHRVMGGFHWMCMKSHARVIVDVFPSLLLTAELTYTLMCVVKLCHICIFIERV